MISQAVITEGKLDAYFARNKAAANYARDLAGAARANFDEILHWCKVELGYGGSIHTPNQKMPTQKEISNISENSKDFFGLNDIAALALQRELECTVPHVVMEHEV